VGIRHLAALCRLSARRRGRSNPNSETSPRSSRVDTERTGSERGDVSKPTGHRDVLPEMDLHVAIGPVGVRYQCRRDAPNAKRRGYRAGKKPNEQEHSAAELNDYRQDRDKVWEWRPHFSHHRRGDGGIDGLVIAAHDEERTHQYPAKRL
jgi:hypothetical protein